MSSSDNSIKLTTHRIINESEEGKQQVILEDYETYQLKRSSIGAYGILFAIFIFITLFITYNKIQNYYESRKIFIALKISLLDRFWDDKGYFLLLFLLLIFYFFYSISRRNIIKIIGKYNSIEFRVKNFNNPSVQKLLNKLVEQSNKRKSLQ